MLHGPRVLGSVSPSCMAERFELDPDVVHELLLDHEARGWVGRAGPGAPSRGSTLGIPRGADA